MSATRTTKRKISGPFANRVIRKRRMPTDDITEADIEWLACAAVSRVKQSAIGCGYDLDDLASHAMSAVAYAMSKWDRSRCPLPYKQSQWVLANAIRHLRQQLKLHTEKSIRRNAKVMPFSVAAMSIATTGSGISRSDNYAVTYRDASPCDLDIADCRQRREPPNREILEPILRKLLGKCDDIVFDWIYRHYFENVTYRTLAEEYGCTPYNVSVRVNRVINKIDKERALEVLA